MLICARLSNELYSKPTRFLLELIQNADDNYYGATMPKLTIVYRKDGHLWVGSNELRFTPDNVRAICRVGGSTKKVEHSQKGYTGEKGIGFKSVFTVADVVSIKSGALEFCFDKSKCLGMIAPKWTTFTATFAIFSVRLHTRVASTTIQCSSQQKSRISCMPVMSCISAPRLQ